MGGEMKKNAPQKSFRFHFPEIPSEKVSRPNKVSRSRLLFTGVLFAAAFAAVGGKLADIHLTGRTEGVRISYTKAPDTDLVLARADVFDRNGVVLATNLPVSSLYADPKNILDASDAAQKLASALPQLNFDDVLAKLKSDKKFVWIYRGLTPRQKFEVNRLGIPGVGFLDREHRVYPQGKEAAHVLGLVDVDGKGIAGIERRFDDLLEKGAAPLALSIDIRVQAALHQELEAAMDRFKARGAAGLVLDVTSGEVMAMVSLPDFDPNVPSTVLGDAGFNRAAKGVYEMGSTFKLFTTAMALDSGAAHMDDRYDASKPLRVAHYTIADDHAKNRWLSVPEILVYSSNIGSARMAMDVGTDIQQAYLESLGLLRKASIELPEVGTPLVPEKWRDINTMTISYGHGIAVSPLQMASGVAAVANGGIYHPPTLLKRHEDEGAEDRDTKGLRVFSSEVSADMRKLMHLVVRHGTGKKAAVSGYGIGGKTGTAEKFIGGSYRKDALISSFVGVFPINAPRYVVLVLFDEPKGDAGTQNYATGGWIAAPVVGRVVQRTASFLGVAPDLPQKQDQQNDGGEGPIGWGRKFASY
jgi:cell division protein FtsI (penicillin-binding protein 3)